MGGGFLSNLLLIYVRWGKIKVRFASQGLERAHRVRTPLHPSLKWVEIGEKKISSLFAILQGGVLSGRQAEQGKAHKIFVNFGENKNKSCATKLNGVFLKKHF